MVAFYYQKNFFYQIFPEYFYREIRTINILLAFNLEIDDFPVFFVLVVFI